MLNNTTKRNEMIKKAMLMNYNIRLTEDDGVKADLPQMHFRGIKVKYFGATNTKGSRVRLYDTRHDKTLFLSYNYKYSNIRDIAYDYLIKQGFEIIGFTWDEKESCYNILTSDFETPLKSKI